MTDIVDIKTRSRMMASIKSKNTKPEILIRRFLHSEGFRFRLHDKKIHGKPDIVLPKYKLIIFVHGCFWHRHKMCNLATNPKQNEEKWQKKFASNEMRDQLHIQKLKDQNWRILILWECGLKSSNVQLKWIPEFVKGNESFFEWPVML